MHIVYGLLLHFIFRWWGGAGRWGTHFNLHLSRYPECYALPRPRGGGDVVPPAVMRWTAGTPSWPSAEPRVSIGGGKINNYICVVYFIHTGDRRRVILWGLEAPKGLHRGASILNYTGSGPPSPGSHAVAQHGHAPYTQTKCAQGAALRLGYRA